LSRSGLRTLALALALVLALLGGPRGVAAAGPDQAPTASLSPELRAAFVAEMQALDKALQAAVSGIARADWPAVERIAGEIRASFLLEQELTPAQREELHQRLPEDFRALDARFHAQAERLARAARAADGELAAFQAYRLIESCVTCHAQYAGHRFGFAAEPPDAHSH